MMKWKRQSINLGNIKVGVKKIVIFESLDILDNIDNMIPSCGCSVPKLEGNKIIVTYTPGTVPIHLYNIGYYTSTKTIIVNYKDGNTDVLSFTAKIFRN